MMWTTIMYVQYTPMYTFPFIYSHTHRDMSSNGLDTAAANLSAGVIIGAGWILWLRIYGLELELRRGAYLV